MSNRAMKIMVKVSHSFPIQEGTFIRVFITHKAPRVLPKFVMYKTLLQEVCYQMTQSFSKILNKGKKKPWPTFPLTIKAYVVEKFKQVEVEAGALKGSNFVTLN